jgi:23S rRNA pseudouridine1911/1915/1917 synthase
MIKKLKVTTTDAGQRLDTLLSMKLGLSRSHWQKEIKLGHVHVNQSQVKPSYLSEEHDSISVHEPNANQEDQVEAPQPNVLYEDNNLLVVEKPAGLLVHPVPGQEAQPTLAHFSALHSTDNDSNRPGIVHRLDRDTSGLILIAKNTPTKIYLQDQFKQRLVKKTYQLLIEGRLKQPEALIDLPIGRKSDSAKRSVMPTGRPAQTGYKVLREFQNYSLVEAYPKTGRTHQLRVHFSHLGHPIAGDQLYSHNKPKELNRIFLHATRLEFRTPEGNSLVLTSQLRPELLHFLNSIE